MSGGDHEDHAASGPLPQERLLFVDAMLNGSRSLVVIPDMIDARRLACAKVLDCRAELRKCR